MNSSIQHWLKSNSAQRYLQMEANSLRKISRNLCGQIGVQLTWSEQVDFLEGLNFSEKYHLSTSIITSNDGLKLDGYARIEELPFESNQFSTVVVPCLSLFTTDIHSAMREVYRVTAPEGVILISGMNPISFMGLQAKCFPKSYPLSPMVGLTEMKSWLSLLGCKVIAGDFFHYHHLSDKPLSSALRTADFVEKVGNRWLPAFSGGYSLLAKKKNGKMINSVAKKF